MISDVLSETIEEINEYLNSDVTSKCYEGAMREAIVEFRDNARAIMVTLDTFPGATVEWRQGQDAHLAKLMTAGEYAAWKALQIRIGDASAAAVVAVAA